MSIFEVKRDRDTRFYPVRVSFYVVQDGCRPVTVLGGPARGSIRMWKTAAAAEAWIAKQKSQECWEGAQS